MDKAILAFGLLVVMYDAIVSAIMRRRERTRTEHKTLRDRDAHMRRIVSHVVDGLLPILAWELIMKPAMMAGEHADLSALIHH